MGGLSRRPRLALACAVSLTCHLVAVTFVVGGGTRAEAIARLDGAISVFPNVAAEDGRPVESQPPTTTRPSPPRASRKLARAPKPRLPPPRPARVARTPTSPPAPLPVTDALTGNTPGSGVASQAPPAQPARPVHIAPGLARSLRIYDTFPRMPELLRMQNRTEAVDVNICVSERGAVREVNLLGASEALARSLREAIASWRYRPLHLAGTPTPFCHALRLSYRS
jgi:outer membrane biosynthesis protein TonB